MASFLARFSFPLLTKELVELSARRRTYLVRVVYAIALYGVTLWTYWRWLGQFEADSFELLGQGQTLFNELLRWQFWGLYLFLPVVTSSAITSEKERDTLSLLLLTKLGSWTILLEKLLSRLVAMGSFLLLGLPLAAVAYSLGGVDVETIWKATYVLCVTSLQVASFALLCSTWFRTTSSAFVGTYLLGTVGVLFGSELLKLVLGLGIALDLHEMRPGLTNESREWFVESVTNNPSYRPLYGPWLLQSDPLGTEHVAQMLGLMPANNIDIFTGTKLIYDISGSTGFVTTGRSFNTGIVLNMSRAPLPYTSSAVVYNPLPLGRNGQIDRTTLTECIACSLPLLGSALAFLILARVFLWRRMRVLETSLLTRLFVVGDRCFQVLNRNPITRGVVFGSARQKDLPVERPIAWRETRKRSLGTARHLIRLLLLLEVPLLGWIGWRLWTWHGAGSLTLASGALLPLWILTVLIVTVQSTGLIATERAKQTLDVLLTTPLPSQDIALQKLAGLRRLMLVLAVPLLTIFVSETAWNVYGSREVASSDYFYPGVNNLSSGYSDLIMLPGGLRSSRAAGEIWLDLDIPADAASSAISLFGQVLGVLVYLPLLGWIGFQFGLRLRTQTQAIWATLAAVGLICIGPSLAVKGVEAAQVWLAPPVNNVHVDGTIHIGGPVIREGPFVLSGESYPSAVRVFPTRPVWLINLAWLSPLRVLFPGAFPRDYADLPYGVWFPLLFHFSMSLGTLCLLRRNALAHFGRWVHRTEAAEGRGRGDTTKENPSPQPSPRKAGARGPEKTTDE
ncbi:MAG: ABC transporter permease subunit [Planctomycetota bacterium]